jgi:negative regulator of genetic competence, sporulation and motility
MEEGFSGVVVEIMGERKFSNYGMVATRVAAKGMRMKLEK